MHICKESVTVPGEIIERREIPSDAALVTPLVVRLVERLADEGLVQGPGRMKVELCLDEAITNAVVHGNRSDFAKTVTVSLFRESGTWGVLIEDQGKGFSVSDLPQDRTSDELVWEENGRGLPLLALYMDEVTYYNGGASLLMRQYVK